MLGFSSFLSQLGGLFGGSESNPNRSVDVGLHYITCHSPNFHDVCAKIPVTHNSGRGIQITRQVKNYEGKRKEEAIDYVKTVLKMSSTASDPVAGVDRFLEYFTILPVDLDPNGLVHKLDHIMRTRDDRVRAEIKKLCLGAGDQEISKIENILEAATALNLIYKVVRHYYLMGKRTTSMFIRPAANGHASPS